MAIDSMSMLFVESAGHGGAPVRLEALIRLTAMATLNPNGPQALAEDHGLGTAGRRSTIR